MLTGEVTRDARGRVPEAAGYDAPARLERLVAGYVEHRSDMRINELLGYDRPADWQRSGIAGDEAA